MFKTKIVKLYFEIDTVYTCNTYHNNTQKTGNETILMQSFLYLMEANMYLLEVYRYKLKMRIVILRETIKNDVNKHN